MTKSTCGTCGTFYEGYSCPMCAVASEIESAAEDVSQAIEIASLERAHQAKLTRNAIKSAANQQRDDVANAWRLEADAKADRAAQLYDSGAYDGALKLAVEALEQDPGNLKPYQVASRALLRSGRGEESSVLIRKQVLLLRNSEYRSSPHFFSSVLTDIPRDENVTLMDAYLEVVRECSSHWGESHELLALVVSLVQRGSLETAKAVIEQIAESKNSFTLQYYRAEIIKRLGSEYESGIRNILAAIPAENRWIPLDRAVTAINKEGFVSSEIGICVVSAWRSRYEEWRPAIRQAFHDQASSEAKRWAESKWGALTSVVVFVLLFFEFGSSFLQSSIVSILAGIFVTHFSKSRIRAPLVHAALKKRVDRENETLRNVFVELGASQPPQWTMAE